MKLADLRKLAIKKQQRIRFHLRNGMDCVVNERGVATVPGLNLVADFNLEQELELAAAFTIESIQPPQKNTPKPLTVSRDELASLLNGAPAGVTHHDEHEDE